MQETHQLADELVARTLESGRRRGDAALLGVMTVYGLFAALVVTGHVLATTLGQGSARWLVYGAMAVICVVVRPWRRWFAAVAAVFLALSMVVTVCQSGVPVFGRDSVWDNLKIFAVQVADTTVQLGRVTARGQDDAGRGPNAHMDELVQGARRVLASQSAGSLSSPYLDAVAPDAPGVQAAAQRLIRGCGKGEPVCATYHLLRFVTDDIAYRAERRGEYVQTPGETIKLAAGDHEDQSILLVSLLRSAGIRAHMAVTAERIYPLVCYERPLDELVHALGERSGDDARSLHAILWPRLMRTPPSSYRLGRDFCYLLEPAVKGAWIGHVRGDARVMALIDPLTSRPLRFGFGPAPPVSR